MTNKNRFYKSSLTQYEVKGLSKSYSFANGHAYQDVPEAFNSIFDQLSDIWQQSIKTSHSTLENRFKTVLSELIKSKILLHHNFFSICPTASNSIDIVSA